MKHFAGSYPNQKISFLIALLISLNFFIGCSIEENEFKNNPIYHNLQLSESLTYNGLKKIVDSQKIYFISNSNQGDTFIYEISLDYTPVMGSFVLSPEDVFLRAEPFVQLDFNGHIAATVDGKYLVVLENGGANIAVVEIETKKIEKFNKPNHTITQAGFNIEGELYAGGGDSFYRISDWNSKVGEATFEALNHEGLPKMSGGDLLFLNHKYKSKSFLSFSRGNDENDGDGAYLIDVIEGDSGSKKNKFSYQKVFEVAPNVTGACVAGINHLFTTHENKSKVNIYSSQGKELFQLNIKTGDGKEFVAGKGDLTSVNNLDEDFFNKHIKNGVVYLSSNEENKIYEINLDNGEHKEIRDGITNSHIGVSNNHKLYYTNRTSSAEESGLFEWHMESNKTKLIKEGLLGEKVVVHDKNVWVMRGNHLSVLDINKQEIIHSQTFDAIGGGGDMLVSLDKAYMLVFDRTNKKIWKINLLDYSISEPIHLPVKEANGAAYNADGTIIVSSQGHLYILDENFELIGEKLLGFTQNNGDMTSTYFNKK